MTTKKEGIRVHSLGFRIDGKDVLIFNIAGPEVFRIKKAEVEGFCRTLTQLASILPDTP